MFCKSIFFTACASLFLYPSKKTLTDSKQEQEIRALLIGKTGVGKSYLGNLILGKKCFSPSSDFSVRTVGCNYGSNNIVFGDKKYKLTIIDTQGLFDIKGQTDVKQNSKNLLDNVIQKIKDLKGINKIIFVTEYQSAIDVLSLYILGALSYCIRSSSQDLLIIVNKSGRGHKYYNEEQKKLLKNYNNIQYNFEQYLENDIQDDTEYEKNIKTLEEQIKYWWGKQFILQNVKDFNTCQNKEEEEKDKKNCRNLLLSNIIGCSFIKPDQIQTWQKTYELFKNRKQIEYYKQLEDLLKEKVAENERKAKEYAQTIADITNIMGYKKIEQTVYLFSLVLFNLIYYFNSDDKELKKISRQIFKYTWFNSNIGKEDEIKINKINSILEGL